MWYKLNPSFESYFHTAVCFWLPIPVFHWLDVENTQPSQRMHFLERQQLWVGQCMHFIQCHIFSPQELPRGESSQKGSSLVHGAGQLVGFDQINPASRLFCYSCALCEHSLSWTGSKQNSGNPWTELVLVKLKTGHQCSWKSWGEDRRLGKL